MKISRRSFFLYCGTGVLAGANLFSTPNVFGQSTESGAFFQVPPESSNDPLNYLRCAHFEAVVNTFFGFQRADGRFIKMRLIEALQHARKENAVQGLTGESYSLLFEGPKRDTIPQGSYQVSHDILGNFSLFIVPVSHRANRYEALVNRINFIG